MTKVRFTALTYSSFTEQMTFAAETMTWRVGNQLATVDPPLFPN